MLPPKVEFMEKIREYRAKSNREKQKIQNGAIRKRINKGTMIELSRSYGWEKWQ